MTKMVDFDPFNTETLLSYFERLSNSNPAPGGGSAAAVAGAMGCSLGVMVCNLTIEKGSSEFLRSPRDRLLEARNALIEFAALDEKAYRRYREAHSLPRETSAEKADRAGQMTTALVIATDVPLRVMTVSIGALDQLTIVARLGSKHTLADVLTASYLLRASALGSLENATINLRMMRPGEQRNALDESVQSLRSAIEPATMAVSDQVAERQEE